jgi:hypothetical protein
MSADPIAVSQSAREAYLSMNMLPEFDAADVRAGGWDKTTGLQAFAIFEAETRKDERERCAKVADDVAEGSRVLHNLASRDHDRDGCMVHGEGWRTGQQIAAAIRNLEEG